MSRRYHRWIATLLGIFILWTAATGVITQITRINTAAERKGPPPGPPASASAAPSAASEQRAPAPPQSANRRSLKLVTDLHSGEQFGLVGQIVSLVTGLALLFLAGSGLWMYIRMFRARASKERAPSRKWFWK
ncbi:MAG: PepSY-associated TM helix domain-containing protein [Sphingomicrobium sp.]